MKTTSKFPTWPLNLTADALLVNLASLLLIFLPIAMVAGRSVLDISFTLIGFLFLVFCFKNRDWKYFKNEWVILALVIWLYLFLRSWMTLDVADNLDRGIFFGRFIIGAVAIHWILSKRKEASKWLFFSLAFSTMFIIFDVFYQYIYGADIFGHKPIDIMLSGQLRLTGPFNDMRAGAMILWMSMPTICGILAYCSRSKPNFKNKFIPIIAVTIFICSIFVTGERMSFLMGTFVIGICFIIFPNQKKILAGIIITFLILLAITIVNNPKIIERQINSTEVILKNFYNTQYGQLWRNGINTGLLNPLFGVGPRNFRELCPQLPPLEIGDYYLREQCGLHPHNLYVEWFAEAGIIGLCLFLLLIYLWSKNLIPVLLENRHDYLLIGVTLAVFIRLWPFQTTNSFFSNSSALPFWIMLGWAMALSNLYREKSYYP